MAKKTAAHKSTNIKATRSRRSKSVIFDTITLEGGLISSAMLARIAARDAGNQSEADYNVPKGLTLRDEIARYFRIGAALFKDYSASPTPSATAVLTFMDGLLRQVLGFTEIEAEHNHSSGVALQAKKGRVPVVVVPPADDLDRPSTYLTGEGRRRSAASALQDSLNHTGQALWGFCANGDRIRLMRANASLTRPAYVVSVRLACVVPSSHVNSHRNSAQLSKEQPDSHVDIAVHLGLSGGSRHEMAAVPAFV